MFGHVQTQLLPVRWNTVSVSRYELSWCADVVPLDRTNPVPA